MPAKSPLDYCEPHIKADLIKEHATTTKTQQQLADWLLEKHGITLSKSAVHRFLQANRQENAALIAFGLSPETLAVHAEELEELKAQLLYREISQRRINELVTGLLQAAADQEETA